MTPVLFGPVTRSIDKNTLRRCSRVDAAEIAAFLFGFFGVFDRSTLKLAASFTGVEIGRAVSVALRAAGDEKKECEKHGFLPLLGVFPTMLENMLSFFTVKERLDDPLSLVLF